MIKKLFLSSAIVLALGYSASAGQAVTGCAAKKQNIENQLDYARKYNNKYEILGLEKALKEVSENCTEENLKAERLAKIAEKEHKVAERQAELVEAKAKGDPKKIAKKEEKVLEAQKELEAAKAELNN